MGRGAGRMERLPPAGYPATRPDAPKACRNYQSNDLPRCAFRIEPPDLPHVRNHVAGTDGAGKIRAAQAHRKPHADSESAACDRHGEKTQNRGSQQPLLAAELDESAHLAEHERALAGTTSQLRILDGETRAAEYVLRPPPLHSPRLGRRAREQCVHPTVSTRSDTHASQLSTRRPGTRRK